MIVWCDPHTKQPNGVTSGDDIAKQEGPTTDPAAWDTAEHKTIKLEMCYLSFVKVNKCKSNLNNQTFDECFS